MDEEGQFDNYIFKEVRVITLALNVDKVRIQAHRALVVPKDIGVEINYTFDVICEELLEHRICALIRNILHEYGVKILHPILQKAYNAVTNVSPAPSDQGP